MALKSRVSYRSDGKRVIDIGGTAEELGAELGMSLPKKRSPASGKGDKRRPLGVSREHFEAEYERIFRPSPHS